MQFFRVTQFFAVILLRGFKHYYYLNLNILVKKCLMCTTGSGSRTYVWLRLSYSCDKNHYGVPANNFFFTFGSAQ